MGLLGWFRWRRDPLKGATEDELRAALADARRDPEAVRHALAHREETYFRIILSDDADYLEIAQDIALIVNAVIERLERCLGEGRTGDQVRVPAALESRIEGELKTLLALVRA